MNVVLLGGTRGMGRELARRMAERGDRVFLLGRDADQLARSVTDLAVRRRVQRDATKHESTAALSTESPSGSDDWALCNLEQPETFEPALSKAAHVLGNIDVVVVTAAMFGTQDELEGNLPLARRLATVNFTNTVCFCEHAREVLLATGSGTLCVFSSVAGERGRKPTVIYGASKAGLTRYLEGLDHRYHRKGLRVVTVKPGFVRTNMTQHLKEPPFAGDVDEVARDVLKAIDKGSAVVYTPGPWKIVMAVVRNLPRQIMRRVAF